MFVGSIVRQCGTYPPCCERAHIMLVAISSISAHTHTYILSTMHPWCCTHNLSLPVAITYISSILAHIHVLHATYCAVRTNKLHSLQYCPFTAQCTTMIHVLATRGDDLHGGGSLILPLSPMYRLTAQKRRAGGGGGYQLPIIIVHKIAALWEPYKLMRSILRVQYIYCLLL